MAGCYSTGKHPTQTLLITTGNSVWAMPYRTPAILTTKAGGISICTRLEHRREINPKNQQAVLAVTSRGIGWYRKIFNVPPAWKGKRVSIYFEGVYMNSMSFSNGKSLGVHPYLYVVPVMISSILGFNRRNVLAVRVDNSQQINCRWYSGSGIYRHVWMMLPAHPCRKPGSGNYNPEVSSAKATVRIKTQVKNETDLPQSIVLKLSFWRQYKNCR